MGRQRRRGDQGDQAGGYQRRHQRAVPRPRPVKSGPPAAFIEQDATTQGTWINTYGAQGDDIEGQTAALPSSATVSFSGASGWTWASSTTDVRALQNPGGSGRSATAWYSSTGFTINLDLTDGQVHDLELYAVDWDNQGRSEQVQILNAATGAVLSTETLSSFHNGDYLQWAVSGDVAIKVTRLGGPNAVISGLFLDPSTTASTSAVTAATAVRAVTTAQGNGIGTDGIQGGGTDEGTAVLPSPATLSVASETTDPVGLESPGGPESSATYGSSRNSPAVNMGLTDDKVHDLALHAIDRDDHGQSETI